MLRCCCAPGAPHKRSCSSQSGVFKEGDLVISRGGCIIQTDGLDGSGKRGVVPASPEPAAWSHSGEPSPSSDASPAQASSTPPPHAQATEHADLF